MSEQRDFILYRDGSLVGIHALSDEAEEWMSDNVQSESWQWLGPVLWIDGRMAGPLLADMVESFVVDDQGDIFEGANA